MTLTDSPGLLWPKIEKPEDGLKLATIHAIGRNAVIEEEVAEFLAATLLVRYPGLLAARYDVVEEGLDGVDVIEAIAKKRGLPAQRPGRRTGYGKGSYDLADRISQRQTGPHQSGGAGNERLRAGAFRRAAGPELSCKNLPWANRTPEMAPCPFWPYCLHFARRCQRDKVMLGHLHNRDFQKGFMYEKDH